MTGSDSVKGTGRPSQHQQREAKVEVNSADQLRRLAIRNCHGNKSHPGSPVLARRRAACNSSSGKGSSSSSSTSSLNQLPHSSPPISSKLADADALVDSTLPPSSDNSSSTVDKPPSSAHKHNPYITRQELLHSLRRTSSNFCVGMTQTTCSSSSSSYVHYTPRHLTRTNFNPKPSSVSRAATATPDSGLGESELTLSGSRDEEASDGHEIETMSLMELPASHARQQHRGSPAPAHSRSHRGASPGLLYRSVEVPAETRHRLHASMKVPRNNNRIQDVHGSHDFRRTGSEGIPALAVRPQRQRSPQRPYRGGGVYNLEVCHTPGSYRNHTPHHTPHPPALTSTPMTTGGGCCAVRVPVHVAVPDKKIRLHIPLGKKTASLV